MNFKIKLIEDALFCTTSLALSYSDPDQKWIIRQHHISLFQDYPNLKPSVGLFLHNDGTEVKLLNVRGELRISQHVPDVPLIIWLHEFYPQVAPVVQVDSTTSMYPLYENNPFVDSSSGATTSSYLTNWEFRKCNLSDLVRSLIKLFSFHHPFYYYSGSSSYSHPSMVHRMEVMDCLTCMLHYDMMAIRSNTKEDIDHLSAIQGELNRIAKISQFMLLGLVHERKILKERVNELTDESDKLSSWLRVYENSPVFYSLDEIDRVFEALDKKSKILLELEASDRAIEDVMYALDAAVQCGEVDFRVYMKEVRALAREQFSHRFRRVKVETSSVHVNML